MSRVELNTALDGVPEFVADAVEQLAASLGDSHPTVLAGRRATAALAAIPGDAVMVTEATLAAAFNRAWPVRRNSATQSALSAALILAALRADP